jgi:hypothetical protein
MPTRHEIEADLRWQMPGTYDLQPNDVQQSLIATRLRELNANQVPEAAYKQRERKPHTPAHPPLPGPDADERDVRAALRDAAAELRNGQKFADVATKVADRAAAAVTECQSAVDAFGDLDDRIKQWQVAKLKAGEPDDPLPYDLQSGLRERSIARDRLERAVSASDTVEDELETAQRRVDAALPQLNHAIASVAVWQCYQFVAELDRLEQQALTLRGKIGSLQLPGRSLPDDIANRPFRPLPPITRDPNATQSWADFMSKLRENAAAKMK